MAGIKKRDKMARLHVESMPISDLARDHQYELESGGWVRALTGIQPSDLWLRRQAIARLARSGDDEN